MVDKKVKYKAHFKVKEDQEGEIVIPDIDMLEGTTLELIKDEIFNQFVEVEYSIVKED